MACKPSKEKNKAIKEEKDSKNMEGSVEYSPCGQEIVQVGIL